ncbi:hypothetical protein KTO63_02310 [Parasegetibacter sp. MAH-26]|uniref:Uncharacterized protein n=1 Tax=Pinibacter aurantiacus TaxID=2851599 RepID=A0A9E2S744_9BACT|nr:hypothetical protein [Pinibacter aurantiacus]
MILRKILQLLSFGLIFYLLADNFSHFDFATSKNNALTSMKKAEIDSIQSIDTVRYKAKEYVDAVRKIQKQYSAKSVATFWLLNLLLLFQIVQLKVNQPTKNKQ